LDLIIHAIIWLLKALFGEHEEPADMSKRQERGSSQRGPYNYGDQRGGGQRPKTLEEILAEVRREAAQRGSGQSHTPVPQQEPRPTRRLVTSSDEEAGETAAPPPSPTPAQRRHLETAPAPAPAAPRPSSTGMPAQQEKQHVPVNPRLERLAHLPQMSRDLRGGEAPAPMGQRPVAPSGEQENERMRTESGMPPSRSETGRAAKGSAAEFARKIREAPQGSKLVLARQAVVVQEVFGPPRSRRPIRAGRR